MTEKEKAAAGELYCAGCEELTRERNLCKDLCHDFNILKSSQVSEKQDIIKRLFGSIKGSFEVTSPFYCDYGYNIEIGDNFYTNHNCVILDCAKVKFGDNIFIGPNCCFSAAGHPINVEQRNSMLEYAYPIIIGNNVWFGASVTVLPGVTIGDNCVIGAGSIVNKDIPPNSVAVGNPCKVIKTLK